MKISVAIATYNGEKYLKAQIDSIRAQLSKEDEIIISDDGSIDKTQEIINDYSKIDNRIKFFLGPGQGHVKNFEKAILATTGDIIVLADQDDIWLPYKIKIIKETFQKNPEIFLVMHNAYFATNNEIENQKYTVELKNIRKMKHGIFNNIWKSTYWGCCMAFKKEMKSIILPFPNKLNMHDQFIGLIGESLRKSYYIDQPLIVHRIHNNNVSSSQNIFGKIDSRLILLECYIKKIINNYYIINS